MQCRLFPTKRLVKYAGRILYVKLMLKKSHIREVLLSFFCFGLPRVMWAVDLSAGAIIVR